MFSKILGKNKNDINGDKEHQIIIDKVSKMHLADMRLYVNNKLNDFEICENGLREVMKRLVSKDLKNNRFIETDAMDSKIKKAFDLVIIIAANKKITVTVAELIQDFIKIYDDLIIKFDKDNKQIYTSKLKDSLALSIENITMMTRENKKSSILGQ